MKYIQQVSEFMAVMGQEMPEQPTIPSQGIQALRYKLIDEENNELSEAAAKNDIIEVADALCDLRYVVEGAFRAYGFSAELADELFDEVQRSNMSKLCQTMEEAADTGDAYAKQGIATYPNKVGEFYAVCRVSDNKVLKSINWSEPDLRSILLKHGVQC